METQPSLKLQSVKETSAEMLESFLKDADQRGFLRGCFSIYPEAFRKGEEKKTEEFIVNLLAKFPKWSDKQIAGLVNAEPALVNEIRQELNNQSKLTIQF